MKKTILLLLLLPLLALQFCDCPEEEVKSNPEKNLSAIRTVLEKNTIAGENEDITMIEEVRTREGEKGTLFDN